jgi:hypothetical protein
LDPGSTVEDAIAVTNHSSAPATVTVAAGVGVVGQDGVFDIAPPSDDSKGGADSSWVEIGGLEDGQLALPALETRVLPVLIAAPAGATPGDHPIGITVALTQGAGVTVTHRVGVRLHLRVDGEIQPRLAVEAVRPKFTGVWWPFSAGGLEVGYEVANTGNTRLGAAVSLRAAGLWGIGSTTVEAEPVTELLPGERVSGSARVPIAALVRLTGAVEAVPTVVGADDVQPPGRVVGEFGLFAIPWALVIVLTLVLAVALVAFRRRRGKRAPSGSTL